MKKGNKNKLAFIKLIADDDIILHAFHLENHMETVPPDTFGGYPDRRVTGRSTITLQIERVKNENNN